ncbi:MAG TPA: serine/threonine-protein kinase [Vicinamibacterales bacterium]|jgi:serine/threonine protein kinase|nr:serine/threonine-protein kinase [Vicinamibacterales bacterium]
MISESALDRLQALFTAPDLSATRYTLVSVLGRGGMAVVYLARDTTLDRDVALKVLDWTVDESAASRLAQEARILARLEHPGIVPVHDFGQLADGRLFYAMKRVRGERLDRWAAGRDVHERLNAFRRVCDAVAFAHAHGVIHRDLKPENVMVGEFGEVLVLDWGIARVDGQSERRGTLVGTPDYMAPEQLRADGVVDERADVFSLGVLLAGLGDDRKALRAIAAKAAAADPAARYGNVSALGADVSRFMAGLAVDALPESLSDRVVRFATRHRVAIALVLTYLAVRLLLLSAFRV